MLFPNPWLLPLCSLWSPPILKSFLVWFAGRKLTFNGSLETKKNSRLLRPSSGFISLRDRSRRLYFASRYPTLTLFPVKKLLLLLSWYRAQISSRFGTDDAARVIDLGPGTTTMDCHVRTTDVGPLSLTTSPIDARVQINYIRLMSYVWRWSWKKKLFSSCRFEPMTSGTWPRLCSYSTT